MGNKDYATPEEGGTHTERDSLFHISYASCTA